MVWTNGSSTRYRLWRDRDRGIIAGVCAGIADYIGVEPIVVRLVAVLGLVFFFPLARRRHRTRRHTAFVEAQIRRPRGAARPDGKPSHLG